jgi:hypothetical protein
MSLIGLLSVHGVRKKNLPYNSPRRPRRGVTVQLYSFLNLGARWCGCSTSRPGRFTPRKETRYPLYKRMGGPQGLSERVQKISSPPEFDLRTVQRIASRYSGPYTVLDLLVNCLFMIMEQREEGKVEKHCTTYNTIFAHLFVSAQQ